MTRLYKIFATVLFMQSLTSFGQDNDIRYAPQWFGPNANPVPEMSDARIPAATTISLMGDYYFGSGDRTRNAYFKIEVPLIPERVSFKVWTSLLEHYDVTDELSKARGMNTTSGKAAGDFYVQTRITLLREKRYAPAIVLNATLKTASGTAYHERRYFDTPGYYFDLEFGKSFYIKHSFIEEIRVVADAGFLCWETTNSTQNDAPMYGIKVMAKSKMFQLENALGGYRGWMNTHDPLQGDIPLVYTGKLSLTTPNLDYFVQYQYGIHDFPYQQVRVGFNCRLNVLTPKFKFGKS